MADPALLAVSGRRLFWQGFAVAISNPKTLFFYAAFFPQFVDPALPPAPQLAALCATFLAVATLFDSSYAVLGGRARGRRPSIGSRSTPRALGRPSIVAHCAG